MFSQIGPLELILVLVIVLVIFGPKRLPGLGKQLGTGMREFKESITGEDKHREDREAADQIALTEAKPQPDVGAAAKRAPADVPPERRG